MKLLLLSNSRSPDGSYLTHARDPILKIVGARTKALFVPYAGVTTAWDDYTQKVQNALIPTGLVLTGAHTVDATDIARFEMIIVGGGNTFQLLKTCRERRLLDAIRSAADKGTPYFGWSAGANLACPSICTTNDMPIVDPQGFDALGLIDFQINPHYTNALPAGHQGETRKQRLEEYLTANPQMRVIGLPEGDWLWIDDATTTFHGPYPGFVFKTGDAPTEVRDGAVIAPC